MPIHPNVRRCTHIQITGHRCGSPALKQEYFCYFHTRMIKGVQTRVDSQIHPVALIENPEAIQSALMHTIDAVLKGTLDNKRANLVLKALSIAVRNSRNVYFHLRQDDMVREVPNYAQQYLTEHPEYGPPLSQCSTSASPGGADTPVRQASTIVVDATHKKPQQTASQKSATAEPAAKRRQPTAHDASRGTKSENDPAPQQRKQPQPDTQQRDIQKEANELKRVQAAIAGAQSGNWRDLRTVFEFAGITGRNEETPS